MTLAELKELVDDMVDQVGDERADYIDVRFAAQPNWPFEYSIKADLVYIEEEEPEIVYIAEESQLRYLPDPVKDALNW